MLKTPEGAICDYLLLTRYTRWFLAIAIVAGVAALPALSEEQPQSAADLIATLQPSVVNLSVTKHTKTAAGTGNIVSQDSVAEKKVQSSGFFVDSSGVILTNRHVIADASEIIVTLHDSSRLRASVMAAATSNDIALLKVNAGKTVPALKFGNSDLLRPGDSVLIIGNPLGLGSTVTAGIVSALDRNTQDSESASFLQIDAALNVGNSGGPVFNKEGDVVGVSTALATPDNQSGSVGLGLAIPGNDARFIMDQLMRYGRVRLGWIGIHVQPVTTDIAFALRLPTVSGSIITYIDDNSPAARAQLRDGDIVLKVDNEDLSGPRDLNRKIVSKVNGSISYLAIWRAGAQLTLPVRIGDLPQVDARSRPAISYVQDNAHAGPRGLGITFAQLTDDVRAKLRMSTQQSGVLVEDVVANSPAWDRGITAGSVIVEINERPVTSPSEALQSIDDVSKSSLPFVLLLIEDTQGFHWTPLPMQPISQ
jgi:serine protease Do